MCDCPDWDYPYARLTLQLNPRVDSYRGFGDFVRAEEPKYNPYNDFFETIKQQKYRDPNVLSEKNADLRRIDLSDFFDRYFAVPKKKSRDMKVGSRDNLASYPLSESQLRSPSRTESEILSSGTSDEID